MPQSLPCSGFEWDPNVNNNFNFDVAGDSHIGYILEVNLDYPEEFHDAHNDIPFCPDRTKPAVCKQ